MSYINSAHFGEIIIDNKKYGQVLIIGGNVSERNTAKLESIYGSTHKIGDWEVKELVGGQPDTIIVGTGWDGALEVGGELKEKARSFGIKLIVEKTPQAMQSFNQKAQSNKKVNALIHTTC
ncbi:MAG: MTH938/NDUFAF3 family protein [Patescibacteria group bacterium]|nr:MTH938/NDUFAF3 family protein [Patescibacteria group bacterium]